MYLLQAASGPNAGQYLTCGATYCTYTPHHTWATGFATVRQACAAYAKVATRLYSDGATPAHVAKYYPLVPVPVPPTPTTAT